MFLLVLLVFFVSGLTSLVLESLWVRMMVLVFGGTTLAVTTILTAFMGGLALGSFLASKWSHRLRRPLVVYGLLEGCIAVSALALPFVLSWMPTVFSLVPADAPFLVRAFVRFCLCLALLLVPTTCMGATLPVLSDFLAARRDDIRASVGLLYSINTFGAVAGAVLGGFVLLPAIGNQLTLWLVCSLLGVISLGMVIVGWRQAPVIPSDDSSSEALSDAASVSASPARTAELPDTAKVENAMLFVIGVTGALAMVCQVIWSRTLALAIGSSSYAFSLILSLFLLGLAFGAFAGSVAVRRGWPTLERWAVLVALAGVFVAVGTMMIDQLPFWFGAITLKLGWHKSVEPVWLFLLKAGLVAVPLLVPTCLMGCFFPIALGLFKQTEGAVARDVGRLYAMSTVGSIVGSGLCGFVLIPLLGLQNSLALTVSLYMLCSALLVWIAGEERVSRAVGQFALVLAVAVGVWWLPKWDVASMNGGFFRLPLLHSHKLEELKRPGKLVFYREGISATVSVQQQGRHVFLKINGKVDASSTGDRHTQIALANVPLALHPNPSRVAVIGWGSGMTSGAALQFPIKQLDAIELEPAVFEASKWFRRWNFQPTRDKRLRMVFNDARNHLATVPYAYDVIISQPSNPWLSGVANLFTVDFFRQVKAKLAPGGIFCQWVQVYELSPRNIKAILRSLHHVFPHIRVYQTERQLNDFLVMASMRPIPLRLKRLQTLFRTPNIRGTMHAMGMMGPPDLVGFFVLDEKGFQSSDKGQKQEHNTDNHNVLEFRSPLDLIRALGNKKGNPFEALLKRWGRVPLRHVVDGKKRVKPDTHPGLWRSMILRYLHIGYVEAATRMLAELAKAKPTYAQLSVLREVHLHMTTDSWDRTYLLSERAKKLRKAYVRSPRKTCTNAILPVTRQRQFATKMDPMMWFFVGKCFLRYRKYADATYAFYRLATHTKQPKARALGSKVPASSRPTTKPAGH